MRHITLLTTIILGLSAFAQSTTHYATVHNNFASLHQNEKATIEGDYLQLENTLMNETIVLDSAGIDPFVSYKYYIHFANLHCREGKFFKAFDKEGKTHINGSPACGIVFNYCGDSYWEARVQCTNSNLYNESVDERCMTVELMKVIDGKPETVETTFLKKDVDLNDGYNYLCVQVDSGNIVLSMGKNKLKEVLRHKMTESEKKLTIGHEALRVGYMVGPAALISIERAVLTRSEVPQQSVNLETPWTSEALDRHFAASKNPFEGYWTYIDRDMEDTWLKLGGRYTIALVETTEGYDVIYVDGAQVKKSLWHSGMKKAVMKKTIFTDNFTCSWIDATQQPIAEDVYATFESGVILTFKFPVYKSQLRFSKVLDSE